MIHVRKIYTEEFNILTNALTINYIHDIEEKNISLKFCKYRQCNAFIA